MICPVRHSIALPTKAANSSFAQTVHWVLRKTHLYAPDFAFFFHRWGQRCSAWDTCRTLVVDCISLYLSALAGEWVPLTCWCWDRHTARSAVNNSSQKDFCWHFSFYIFKLEFLWRCSDCVKVVRYHEQHILVDVTQSRVGAHSPVPLDSCTGKNSKPLRLGC